MAKGIVYILANMINETLTINITEMENTEVWL